MSYYQDFKSFYQSNILLYIILLFVIVYAIINWNIISQNSNYFGGEYIKPILITGIFFLISHMLITWDDDSNNSNNSNYFENEILDIPKYKFQSGINNEFMKNDGITFAPNVNKNISNNLINPIDQVNPVNPTQSIQQSFSKKYSIINEFDSKQNIGISNNLGINTNKPANTNIFISHKNPSKYIVNF